MFDFKLNLIAGTIFEQIRKGLEEVDSLYLGLFISELRYDTEQEGDNKKKEFYQKLSVALKKINKEIKKFNFLIKQLNKDLSLLREIELSPIKKIIEKHKGDYPQGGFKDELLGMGDSASVLSRKHTALLIHNILLVTRSSMKDFLQSFDSYLSPFSCIKGEKIRKITEREVDKIKAIYSIGCLGESVFMIGRLLENTITEYLLLAKKQKKIDLKNKQIKSTGFTFENKIDFLHNKKLKVITKSQWAKMKSVKWDRNIYGHYNRIKPKDANAIVVIGLQSVEFLDQKIQKLKNKK